MTSKNTRANDRRAKAAEAFAEAQRKQRRRTTLSVIGVVVAIAVIIGGGVGFNKWREDRAKDDLESNVASTATKDYSLIVGDDDAEHKVIIYEDFICPICADLESIAGEGLNQAIADGTVQVDYRPIAFLRSYSDDALNALFVVRDEAGVDVAKKFHDILFANQPDENADTYPGADWLIEKAVEAGATEAQVKDGIENNTEADAVKAATEASSKAGVTGTPTILVDGKVYNDGFDNLVAAVS